jgi:hypothetical protein
MALQFHFQKAGQLYVLLLNEENKIYLEKFKVVRESNIFGVQDV